MWFDDGDGIAEKVEIKHVSQFIESIDISDVELITTNPEWAEGNRVLRSFLATNNENIYTMYDIGLATRPVQKQTSIELDITERINITEGSDLGTIQINCEESIRWRNENKDNLTLLRLSGLPEEIKPSIGVKDELGDWLMTWKGLRDNSQVIELIQDSDWSGDATLQIIVSQLQDDGTIRSSNLENILLEVKAAADPPILIVQDQRVLEDQIVYLSNIIQLLESTDKDGSEKLGIKVEESKGLELMKINKEGELVKKKFGELIRSEDIENYIIVPENNINGIFDVRVVACSIDGNDINQTVESDARLIFTAVADGVKDNIEISNSLSLVEGITKPLKELINIKQEENKIDTDGSEVLEVEIVVSNNISFNNEVNDEWKPIQTQV